MNDKIKNNKTFIKELKKKNQKNKDQIENTNIDKTNWKWRIFWHVFWHDKIVHVNLKIYTLI